MHTEITPYLQQIEFQEGISIVGAWQEGSRAIGWDTDDSDYDISFAYVQPKERYITRRGHIESIDSDHHTLETTPESDIDPREIEYMGWDVKKFFDMLYNGKYTAIDCLIHPTYRELPSQYALREYVLANVSPIDVFYNFQSSVEREYTKYIKPGKDRSPKRVLLMAQDLLRARYTKETQQYPPLIPPFREEYFVEFSVEQMEELIHMKKEGYNTLDYEDIPFDALEEFIDMELDVPKYTPISSISRPKLDSFLHNVV